MLAGTAAASSHAHSAAHTSVKVRPSTNASIASLSASSSERKYTVSPRRQTTQVSGLSSTAGSGARSSELIARAIGPTFQLNRNICSVGWKRICNADQFTTRERMPCGRLQSVCMERGGKPSLGYPQTGKIRARRSLVQAETEFGCDRADMIEDIGLDALVRGPAGIVGECVDLDRQALAARL